MQSCAMAHVAQRIFCHLRTCATKALAQQRTTAAMTVRDYVGSTRPWKYNDEGAAYGEARTGDPRICNAQYAQIRRQTSAPPNATYELIFHFSYID
ncbi:hypothetical protein G7K_6325-t1 [Saitoella complicata NRRL Y-17804]|uniref:Uncharacterized protein n=1 Tax=Saitoella complicata (strain BCRC 22490 / CBS 7301 / JCM 7358 / NBRC 10748 / NRRL Y-17804) TaxID=698492 RepID=A0A0E9NQW0_SAICN|nr:hypothetical protein G7K_6325-t1 [Saitoella complicata NRRL Y-17804]